MPNIQTSNKIITKRKDDVISAQLAVKFNFKIFFLLTLSPTAAKIHNEKNK